MQNLTVYTILFLLGIGTLSHAAQPYQPKVINPLTESWRWTHFSEVEGKGIRNIVEDQSNTIWVSSNEGLLEYDGYQWSTHEQLNEIISAPPEEILVGRDQHIYVTTTHGIYMYDHEEWSPYYELPDEESFDFTQIKQLKDGTLIASSNHGVLHFRTDGTDFYTSPVKKKILEQYISDVNWILLPDESLLDGDFMTITDVLLIDQKFWFAITPKTEHGKVLIFDPTEHSQQYIAEYHILHNTDQYPLGESQKILLSQKNEVWLINSTTNKGLSVLTKEGQIKKQIKLSKIFGGDEYMSSIKQTQDGTIWISGMARVYTLKDQEWNIYKAPSYPVPANHIILQLSKNNKLWIAGYKSKMLLLDLSNEEQVSYTGLNYQCQVSPTEQWYVSIDDKIVQHKDGQWISYDSSDGLMDQPTSLLHTSQGQLWATGSHRGKAATALYTPDGWELTVHPSLSWGIDYRTPIEARDGSIWFGASVDAEVEFGYYSGVLQLVNPSSPNREWIHHRNEENGLLQSSIYGIGESPDGRIWIGGIRLSVYDGDHWSDVPDERLQQYVNIVTSTEDLLLVGSRYYGLFIYDGESWTNYNTTHGLSSNTIISIDAISRDHIYVSTDNGICRFDGVSWTQDVFPERFDMNFEGGSILHTDESSIWINKSPRGWKRRAYQENTERIDKNDFFTTRLPLDDLPPETSIDFFLESVSREGNSVINWSGSDYYYGTPNNRLSYSYRLDGGEWSPFSEEEQYTFTSLGSGKHTLEVRARDLDFNIDPTPAVVEFKVLPPLWKQAWFLLLIGGFLTIFGIYEYRVLSKKRKLEILNDALQKSNADLIEGRQKIEQQNKEILEQQEKILLQSHALEQSNIDLESRNKEVQHQKDQLEEMVLKVENLSKAKVGFFTNISHELRTPLTLILGPAQQLMHAESISPDDRNRLYRTIHKNASRLLKLINQLLEMRRIEQSSLELKLSNINLEKFSQEIISMFETLAIRRDIFLSLDTDTIAPQIAVDTDKVEKIMVNLLSNAFKNTRDGGSISLSLDTVSHGEEQLPPFYEDYVKITIVDSGVGMTQAQIDRIFERYYTQSNEKHEGNIQHTGIGLSYVQDLVYLMQGEIRVASQPEQGTTFSVYLPLLSSETHISEDQPSLKTAQREVSALLSHLNDEEWQSQQQSKPQATKILVVDDNRDMRQFLQSVLRSKYEVITAENGEAALKIANSQNLDLIVSDVIMPEIDGYALCERIKNNINTSHLPVILLTAKIMEENKKTGYQMGADDYITKPFNPELLFIRIENLLNQRKQLRDKFTKEFILTPNTETIVSQDEILLQKIVDMMETHIGDASFNVDKMCKMVHLSHMHFIRKVKQLTGKKPIDLLKSYRMKKAKDLLEQQKISIAEVGYKVGFDLPNSFSRAFKKEFGMSPTQYVNAHKKNTVLA